MERKVIDGRHVCLYLINQKEEAIQNNYGITDQKEYLSSNFSPIHYVNVLQFIIFSNAALRVYLAFSFILIAFRCNCPLAKTTEF